MEKDEKKVIETVENPIDEAFASVTDLSEEENQEVSEENNFIEEEPVIEENTIIEEEAPAFEETAIDEEEIDQTENNINYLTEKEDKTNESADFNSDLKKDIKSVLLYMDQLLENLPEEKIIEFAKSDEFATYKKLFSELGLS